MAAPSARSGSSRPVAFITGGNSGIGAEFARQLAARGYDLVLVARDRERLQRVAAELCDGYGAAVDVIDADLSDPTALRTLEGRLADTTRPVALLVNNAGYGLRRSFLANDIETEERLLDVHVRATLRLTHAALQGMAARGEGAVVNVSSVAGYVPRGTYAAAKAWVTSFSQGQAAAMRGTGVRVMVLVPGFVRTPFPERMGLRTRSLPGPLWLRVEDVVRTALRDLERGRVVSIPSRRYRLFVALTRVAPLRVLAAVGKRHPASRPEV